MHGFHVVLFVVNGGEFLLAAFVVAGDLLSRVVFGLVTLPVDAPHFPVV